MLRAAMLPESAEATGAACLRQIWPVPVDADESDSIRHEVALRLLSLALWDLRQVRRAFSKAE